MTIEEESKTSVSSEISVYFASFFMIVHSPTPLAGFDVVGSPAELQAEVPGRPPKTTGTNASANDNLALAA
jgi:hypothetical protein